MTYKHLTFVMAFLGLLIYATSLNQNRAGLTRHLGDLEQTEREYAATKDRLEQDIRRVDAIRLSMTAELEAEEKLYNVLQATLLAIQQKLHGTEQLHASIVMLRSELNGLKGDLDAYQNVRRIHAADP